MKQLETLNLELEMQDELLTPHFALREFIESPTARKYDIANIPPPEAVGNLRRLCENTLEPLRESLGLPVIITSGYRCKALNIKVAHQSDKSQHLKGQAADFYIGWSAPPSGRGQAGCEPTARERLIEAFRLILTSSSIDFDQLILYPNFIHVSYVSCEANRHTILLGKRDGKLGYGKCSLQNALKIQ